MGFFVRYGNDVFGPYEDWAKAYEFGLINFGAFGWRIVKLEIFS